LKEEVAKEERRMKKDSRGKKEKEGA